MSSQVVEEQSRALQLDALRSSHPVEVPIRHAKADAFGFSHGTVIETALNSFILRVVWDRAIIRQAVNGY